MAPTGVAAINIDGTTINTGLAIPKESGDNLPAMSDKKNTQIRLTMSDLKLMIIDEMSMVGNTTLLHIHQRLKKYLVQQVLCYLQVFQLLLWVIYTNSHQYVKGLCLKILKMML